MRQSHGYAAGGLYSGAAADVVVRGERTVVTRRTTRAWILSAAAGISLMAAAVVVLAASGRAASVTNPDDQIYLTYQGSLERTAWLGHTGTGQPFGKLDVKLSWNASAQFPNQASFGSGVPINYTTLQGTISLDDSGDPSPQTSGLKSCEATLSKRVSSYTPMATTAYDLPSQRYRMNLYQPPLTAYLLQSSDTSGDYCTVNPAQSSAVGFTMNQWPAPTNDPTYTNAWTEYETFPEGAGPFLTTFFDTYRGPQGEIEDITNRITASDSPIGAAWPPGPPSSAPPKPSKAQIQAAFMFAQRNATIVCAEASYYGWTHLRDPSTKWLVQWGDVECARWMGELQAAYDAFVQDPPDSHYIGIALPAAWPAPRPSHASCPRRVRRAACRRLDPAFTAYEAEQERVAEIWEVLAQTANRWGSAYAAFATDPTAPQGSALQTALSKAYYGELGRALSREASAGRKLRSAMRSAGFGRVSATTGQRAGAQRLLDRSQPPAWLARRLVSDGVVPSATSLGASWHAILKSVTVPASIDVASRFAVVGSVPRVPGETSGSITLADVYWIADATPMASVRSVLLADLQAAHNAKDSASEQAALDRFLTDVKQHLRGELSTLLQAAVGALR